jgi:predicted methyltransferase
MWYITVGCLYDAKTRRLLEDMHEGNTYIKEDPRWHFIAILGDKFFDLFLCLNLTPQIGSIGIHMHS